MAPGLVPSRTLVIIMLSRLLVMGIGQAQDSQRNAVLGSETMTFSTGPV